MTGKPWLQHYDPDVPPTLAPYPQRTLIDVLRAAAGERPDHPALIFKGTPLSYGALERQSNALASALAALGVKQGERVALILPNSPQTLVCQFGVWKAGAIATPINPLYTEDELEHALQVSGATAAVALTSFYPKVKAIQGRTSLRFVIATNIKEYLSPVLRLLFTVAKEKKEGHRISLQAGDYRLQELLQQYSHAAAPTVSIGAGDPAVLLFTGGTTGTPKAAVGTHGALVMAGMQIHAWLGAAMTPWEDRVLCNMPLFHVYGQGGVLTCALVGHHPLVMVPNPRDLGDMLATIHKSQPAFLPGVPTLFIALLNHPKVLAGKADLRSVKLCLCGAAPLLADTKQRFEALTGGRIVEGYGLTESMMATVLTPVNGVYKEGSTGLPLPDVELRIVDTESGAHELPAGMVGEVLMRAPQVMQGYWRNPDETALAVRDGWLYTGDLGYLDEDGYLFLVDRKKDVIKPSGFQVWPREVEEVLAAHPAVAEVGVAGIPDAYSGEAVKAWVVLREGRQVSVEELRAHCGEKLAAYKVPKQIEFRTALPKTMVGKVLRRELAAEAARTGVPVPAAAAKREQERVPA
ncbi:MAG: long-chain fatty acid--CoA ligase [Caldilineaceae bacterium]